MHAKLLVALLLPALAVAETASVPGQLTFGAGAMTAFNTRSAVFTLHGGEIRARTKLASRDLLRLPCASINDLQITEIGRHGLVTHVVANQLVFRILTSRRNGGQEFVDALEACTTIKPSGGATRESARD